MDAHTALELVKDATGRANEIAALQARDDFQDDSAPLTEEEQAEAKALHEKAKSQVGRALRIVRAQLAAMDSKVKILILLLWPLVGQLNQAP